MGIFHGYVSHNQMVFLSIEMGVPLNPVWFCWSLSRFEKWLAIIGKINPTFSDKPKWWFSIENLDGFLLVVLTIDIQLVVLTIDTRPGKLLHKPMEKIHHF